MGSLKLAVIIKNPVNSALFLLEKQKQPAKFGEEAYDSFVDSHLWDLPSTDLPSLEDGTISSSALSVAGEEIDLKKFDLETTLNRLLASLGIEFSDVGEWSFVRYVVEPEFGPDSCVRTCFLSGELLESDKSLQDNCKWMSMEACFDCLVVAEPGSDRVGSLVLLGLGDGLMKQKLSPSLPVQEYPPGVMVVPMRSRTLRPFTTTNLVVFAPENVSVDDQKSDFVIHGDALIVDPGCHSKLHTELKKIVDALPRKLIVFVTHHHRDHIGGLSAIQESNPDAILVAHVKTKNRIGIILHVLEEAYDSFVDSHLWDLPSTDLPSLEDGTISSSALSVAGEEIDLKKFDLETTLNRLLASLGIEFSDVGEWSFVRYVVEPEFGPDSSVRTCFLAGKLLESDKSLQDNCKWMSMEACFDCLVDPEPGCDRVGPLVLLGLGDGVMKQKLSPSLPVQEYPPGVMVVPMRSRTLRPFTTTNLVVFAPENVSVDDQKRDFVIHGDALIVDPGCHSKLHTELKKIVDALPRKLIVFVTHHHRDHIGGLSAIQESNPDAILVAHVKTRNRIDGWSGNYTPVSGGENIFVNGQSLTVIFAPGHTDGHMALLHNSTRSLIVGDHCVGKGSAFLDIRSGGNMTEYFQTTYKFLELSPHVVIPMHGRVNLWPKHMLCGYLKNRRGREDSILKATEDGAQTLFEIVSNVYSKVDRSFWWAAASNVRLHIDNLAVENKLPEGFSIQKFKASCGFSFKVRWAAAYIGSRIPCKINKPGLIMSVIAAGAGYFLLHACKRKNSIES